MNFVYDPVNAAQLTAYVQYVSPVKGVRDELSRWAATPPRWPTARCCSRPTRTRPGCTCSPTCPTSSTSTVTDRFLTITEG